MLSRGTVIIMLKLFQAFRGNDIYIWRSHLSHAVIPVGNSCRPGSIWGVLLILVVICRELLKAVAVQCCLNTLRPRPNGRHLADDIFKCIFRNENVWISINISLKVVTMGLIDNIPALVQIMAWRRSGDKPLSEPMMDSLLTHICVTRPQWVN